VEKRSNHPHGSTKGSKINISTNEHQKAAMVLTVNLTVENLPGIVPTLKFYRDTASKRYEKGGPVPRFGVVTF
jgi:hypothetical protein